MEPEAACNLLHSGKRLGALYHGFPRVVEIHAVGFTEEGHAVMLVWQVRGGSVSHVPTGWKLFRLDEIGEAGPTDEPSTAPRPGYNGGGPAMARTLCELPYEGSVFPHKGRSG